MITALAQFHHCVHQIRNISRCSALGQKREVAFQYRTVVLLLYVGQFDFNDRLFLWSQTLLNIFLQPPKHHWLQKLHHNPFNNAL